jgi:hypothetical protein
MLGMWLPTSPKVKTREDAGLLFYLLRVPFDTTNPAKRQTGLKLIADEEANVRPPREAKPQL